VLMVVVVVVDIYESVGALASERAAGKNRRTASDIVF